MVSRTGLDELQRKSKHGCLVSSFLVASAACVRNSLLRSETFHLKAHIPEASFPLPGQKWEGGTQSVLTAMQ